MSIKAKQNDLYYLGCLICEAINDFEILLTENLATAEKLIYHPHLQHLFALRNRLRQVLVNDLPTCDT
jgi:hypothetical protein